MDWYREDYTAGVIFGVDGRVRTWDLDAKVPFRAIRGGSWNVPLMDCRIAFRRRYRPGYRNSTVGLRLVRVDM
jgi:formylglycine-generating enzyme required for sulfatase activity